MGAEANNQQQQQQSGGPFSFIRNTYNRAMQSPIVQQATQNYIKRQQDQAQRQAEQIKNQGTATGSAASTGQSGDGASQQPVANTGASTPESAKNSASVNPELQKILEKRGWPKGVPFPGLDPDWDPKKLSKEEKNGVAEYFKKNFPNTAKQALESYGLGDDSAKQDSKAPAKKDSKDDYPKGAETPLGYSSYGQYVEAAQQARKDKLAIEKNEQDYKQFMRESNMRQARNQEIAQLQAAREELGKHPNEYWQDSAYYADQINRLRQGQRASQGGWSIMGAGADTWSPPRPPTPYEDSRYSPPPSSSSTGGGGAVNSANQWKGF